MTRTPTLLMKVNTTELLWSSRFCCLTIFGNLLSYNITVCPGRGPPVLPKSRNVFFFQFLTFLFRDPLLFTHFRSFSFHEVTILPPIRESLTPRPKLRPSPLSKWRGGVETGPGEVCQIVKKSRYRCIFPCKSK